MSRTIIIRNTFSRRTAEFDTREFLTIYTRRCMSYDLLYDYTAAAAAAAAVYAAAAVLKSNGRRLVTFTRPKRAR